MARLLYHSDSTAKQLIPTLLIFLLTGYDVTKPNVIIKLEQGEEPWMMEGDCHAQSHLGKWMEGEILKGGHSN